MGRNVIKTAAGSWMSLQVSSGIYIFHQYNIQCFLSRAITVFCQFLQLVYLQVVLQNQCHTTTMTNDNNIFAYAYRCKWDFLHQNKNLKIDICHHNFMPSPSLHCWGHNEYKHMMCDRRPILSGEQKGGICSCSVRWWRSARGALWSVTFPVLCDPQTGRSDKPSGATVVLLSPGGVRFDGHALKLFSSITGKQENYLGLMPGNHCVKCHPTEHRGCLPWVAHVIQFKQRYMNYNVYIIIQCKLCW